MNFLVPQVCERWKLINHRMLELKPIYLHKKSYLNFRNSEVKLNEQLIVAISTWAISLTQYFLTNVYATMN